MLNVVGRNCEEGDRPMTIDWDRIFRPNQLAQLAETDPRGFLEHVSRACARYMWQEREREKELFLLAPTMDDKGRDRIRDRALSGVKNLARNHGLSFPVEEVKEKVRVEVEREAWLKKKRG